MTTSSIWFSASLLLNSLVDFLAGTIKRFYNSLDTQCVMYDDGSSFFNYFICSQEWYLKLYWSLLNKPPERWPWNWYKGGSRQYTVRERHFSNWFTLRRNALAAWAACLDPRLGYCFNVFALKIILLFECVKYEVCHLFQVTCFFFFFFKLICKITS